MNLDKVVRFLNSNVEVSGCVRPGYQNNSCNYVLPDSSSKMPFLMFDYAYEVITKTTAPDPDRKYITTGTLFTLSARGRVWCLAPNIKPLIEQAFNSTLSSTEFGLDFYMIDNFSNLELIMEYLT